MTNITKIHISSWLTELNRMGFSPEMQIIGYSFIILKHIQIDFQFWKLLNAESPIVIFLGTNGMLAHC